MGKYSLLVFDWDGTLLDSQAQIVNCMQSAISELGLEPRSDNQINNIIGLGLETGVVQLYPMMDMKLVTKPLKFIASITFLKMKRPAHCLMAQKKR